MPENPVKPWNASRLGWLALTSFHPFGSRTFARLRAYSNGDGARALACPAAVFNGLHHTAETLAAFFTYRKTVDPLALARRLDETDIRFLVLGERDFPVRLAESSDAPAALFVRGEIAALHRRSVSIVGTRAATAYGHAVASELGAALAQERIVVVSGLALGIDAVVHAAAADACGVCVAVLGSGVDEPAIYPRANGRLAERLLETGGALVSEFPPETKARKHHFPLRNRIIAALSEATVVVEADENSGSLITAKLALDDNRDVYAVPGPITSVRSRGTNLLISQGAIPYLGPEQLLEALCPGRIRDVPAFDPAGLGTAERAVWDALATTSSRDDLARALRRSASDITSLLTALELAGAIRSEAGGRIRRNGSG